MHLEQECRTLYAHALATQPLWLAVPPLRKRHGELGRQRGLMQGVQGWVEGGSEELGLSGWTVS